MKSRLLILFGLAISILLATTGCYTVLRHPAGSGIVDESTYDSSIYYSGAGGSCARCHACAEYYQPFYRYGVSHYRWNDYYGLPWWHHDDWWWSEPDYPEGDEYEGPEIEQGTRHLWGSSGWATKGWGGSPASPPERAPSSEPKTEEAKPKPKPKDEEKKDDEPDLWQNRKKGF